MLIRCFKYHLTTVDLTTVRKADLVLSCIILYEDKSMTEAVYLFELSKKSQSAFKFISSSLEYFI